MGSLATPMHARKASNVRAARITRATGRNTGRIFAALALLIGMLAFTPAARAQASFSMNMDMGEMSAPIAATSLKTYAKILGLDDTQREALEALHQGYREQHQTISKEMQDGVQAAQDKFNETKDPSVWANDFPKTMRTLGLKMENLEKEFFDDIKATLNEAQMGKFAGVERHRRRDKHMRFGMVSGENADLFKAAERAGVDPVNGPSAELFKSYEAEIDKVLVARDQLGKDAMKEPEGGGGFDAKALEQAMKMMKTMREQGIQMRGVNKDFARRITGALPEAEGTKFEREYNKIAFPRIYRESHVTKMLDTAAKLEDLEASQKETLSQIREQYDRELAASNEKWAIALQDRDDKIGDDPMAMAQVFMPNPNDKGPLADAKKSRRDLDERTGDRVLALLNASQKEKMPKPPKKHVTERGDGPFEFEVTEGGDMVGEFETDSTQGEVQIIVSPSGGG